jgi:hypothetical protein
VSPSANRTIIAMRVKPPEIDIVHQLPCVIEIERTGMRQIRVFRKI